MSARLSGRFSSAFSAAEQAKNADQAFHAYLPPLTSSSYSINPPNEGLNKSQDKELYYNPEESYTYGKKKVSSISSQSPTSRNTEHNNNSSTLSQPMTTHSPKKSASMPLPEKMAANGEDIVKELIQEADDEIKTQKTQFYDTITLKHLTVLEKTVIIVVTLGFLILQLYYHSIYDLFIHGFATLRTQSATLLQSLYKNHFSGINGAKNIGSIVLGTALSVFFDAKPAEIDKLCLSKIKLALQPVFHLVNTTIQHCLRIFTFLQSLLRLWQATPRVLKYVVCLLLLLVSTRQAVIAIYVNVFVTYGETMAKMGGFFLILLVFCLLGTAGYGIVYARDALLMRKKQAVDAATEAVLLCLHSLHHPVPISYIHRTLLDLEAAQHKAAGHSSSNNGQTDTLANNNDNNNNNNNNSGKTSMFALFLSPSGKQHLQSSSTTSDIKSIPLSLPTEVLHMSIAKIWPEIVRRVSMDSRVRTTMRHVNGKNEQCWTYIAPTHVSVGTVRS